MFHSAPVQQKSRDTRSNAAKHRPIPYQGGAYGLDSVDRDWSRWHGRDSRSATPHLGLRRPRLEPSGARPARRFVPTNSESGSARRSRATKDRMEDQTRPRSGRGTSRSTPRGGRLNTVDWQIECSRDLVLAILRLAVTDYLGIAYGHDEPGPMRCTRRSRNREAEHFLKSPWCAYLSDLIGLWPGVVWRLASLMNSPEDIDATSATRSLAA